MTASRSGLYVFQTLAIKQLILENIFLRAKFNFNLLTGIIQEPVSVYVSHKTV